MKSSLLIMLSVLLSVLLMPVASHAEDASSPTATVEDATERMIQALSDQKVELEQNPDLIYSLVEDILMPNFDFGKMAKLALGKNWRKANSEQKVRFTEEFKLLLVRTYSTAMLEYSDQKIEFLPSKLNAGDKKTKVEMEVIQPGGPSIPMTLSMYLTKAKKWKAYDVKIDGISLVTNYRSTFSNQIRNGGMDKLIEDLANRNAKTNS